MSNKQVTNRTTTVKSTVNLEIEENKTLFSFSTALDLVKRGGSIARSGWNGKDLMVKAQYPDENSKMTLPYLYIEYPSGERCPWLASQTDLMSEDWYLI